MTTLTVLKFDAPDCAQHTLNKLQEHQKQQLIKVLMPPLLHGPQAERDSELNNCTT